MGTVQAPLPPVSLPVAAAWGAGSPAPCRQGDHWGSSHVRPSSHALGSAEQPAWGSLCAAWCAAGALPASLGGSRGCSQASVPCARQAPCSRRGERVSRHGGQGHAVMLLSQSAERVGVRACGQDPCPGNAAGCHGHERVLATRARCEGAGEAWACAQVGRGALGEGGCSALRRSVGQSLDTAAGSPPAPVLVPRAAWAPAGTSAVFSEVSSPRYSSAPRLLPCLRLENPFPQGALYTGFIFQCSANKFLPNCPNE